MTELDYLRDRCITIIEFFDSIGGQSMDQLKSLVLNAYEKKNIKGLRTASRDMNAWAKSLRSNEKEALEKILGNKFGEDLSGDKITHAVIKTVLKAGKIEKDEHYRTVHEYLNDISPSDPYYDKINLLQTFIAKYNGGNKITED